MMRNRSTLAHSGRSHSGAIMLRLSLVTETKKASK